MLQTHGCKKVKGIDVLVVAKRCQPLSKPAAYMDQKACRGCSFQFCCLRRPCIIGVLIWSSTETGNRIIEAETFTRLTRTNDCSAYVLCDGLPGFPMHPLCSKSPVSTGGKAGRLFVSAWAKNIEDSDPAELPASGLILTIDVKFKSGTKRHLPGPDMPSIDAESATPSTTGG